jgi:hypothetical protein
VTITLQNLIETPLYKKLNVTIHHQLESLLASHINSNFQIPTYNNARFDNFDFNNEKMHYTPTNLMIHKFLEVSKIMDYENTTIYFVAPNQNFHPLGLFKIKHLKELKFSTLFYGQFRQFFKVFHSNKWLNGNFFINLGIFQQIFLTFF